MTAQYIEQVSKAGDPHLKRVLQTKLFDVLWSGAPEMLAQLTGKPVAFFDKERFFSEEKLAMMSNVPMVFSPETPEFNALLMRAAMGCHSVLDVADKERCYLLAHQFLNPEKAAAHVIVTNDQAHYKEMEGILAQDTALNSRNFLMKPAVFIESSRVICGFFDTMRDKPPELVAQLAEIKKYMQKLTRTYPQDDVDPHRGYCVMLRQHQQKGAVPQRG